MLKPQKKLKRKEIREDKFVQTTMQAKAFMEDNYQKVITITLSVFGILILIMAFGYYQNQKNEKAAELLGKAQLEYQNLNFSKSKEFLSRLQKEYSGTDAAGQGTFLMANLLFQEKNYVASKNYFKSFIDDYSGSEFLEASGYAGYAACLEEDNEYAQAAEYYEKARKTAPDFVEASNYLYLSGLNYINANQPEKARKQFQLITKKYSDSKRNRDAEAQLIILAEM